MADPATDGCAIPGLQASPSPGPIRTVPERIRSRRRARRPVSPAPGSDRPRRWQTVKRIRIQKPRARRERSWSDVLPPDPRDPDVVRAKALARARTPIGK